MKEFISIKYLTVPSFLFLNLKNKVIERVVMLALSCKMLNTFDKYQILPKAESSFSICVGQLQIQPGQARMMIFRAILICMTRL